jgi:signal peptidase II
LAFVALLLSAVLVAADQILKLLAVDYLKPVGAMHIVPGFLDLTYIPNSGAAFSMLEGQRWLFVGITFVICVAIVLALFRYQNHSFCSYTASVLIVGGGVGNMIDRVLHGYVVDYIHVLFFPAIFNFGDCCVTVGTIFLILHVLFFSDNGNVEKVLRTK